MNKLQLSALTSHRAGCCSCGAGIASRSDTKCTGDCRGTVQSILAQYLKRATTYFTRPLPVIHPQIHPIVLTDSAAAAHARPEVCTEFTQGTLSLRNVTMYSFETTVRSKRQDTLPRHTAQQPSDSNQSHSTVQTDYSEYRPVGSCSTQRSHLTSRNPSHHQPHLSRSGSTDILLPYQTSSIVNHFHCSRVFCFCIHY